MHVRLVAQLERTAHAARLQTLRWLLPKLVELRRSAQREGISLDVKVEDDPPGGSVNV